MIAGSANKLLLIVPPLVAHAIQNLGEEPCHFINMPTLPYRHEDPDKYRLPIESGIINYDFSRI